MRASRSTNCLKFAAKVSELAQAFGATGRASKIKKVFNLEEMQKRYDKGELYPKDK